MPSCTGGRTFTELPNDFKISQPFAMQGEATPVRGVSKDVPGGPFRFNEAVPTDAAGDEGSQRTG